MTDAVHPTEGPDTGTTMRRASPAAGAARRRRAPSPKVTVMAALAGFLVVFELLAYQLRSGHDPAIGSGPLTAQVSSSAAGTQQASGSSRAVVTRASGGSAGVAQTAPVPATGARPPQQTSHAVTTRTSGGGSLGTSSAHGDDQYEQEGEL